MRPILAEPTRSCWRCSSPQHGVADAFHAHLSVWDDLPNVMRDLDAMDVID